MPSGMGLFFCLPTVQASRVGQGVWVAPFQLASLAISNDST